MSTQTPSSGETRADSSSSLPVCFTIPSIPPSMNVMYGINHRTHTVYLKNEARYWKSKAKLFMPNIQVTPEDKLRISVDVVTQWYFKNGNPKKADVQNLGKVILDALSERWNIDDCRFWEIELIKINSDDRNEIRVLVEQL